MAQRLVISSCLALRRRLWLDCLLATFWNGKERKSLIKGEKTDLAYYAMPSYHTMIYHTRTTQIHQQYLDTYILLKAVQIYRYNDLPCFYSYVYFVLLYHPLLTFISKPAREFVPFEDQHFPTVKEQQLCSHYPCRGTASLITLNVESSSRTSTFTAAFCLDQLEEVAFTHVFNTYQLLLCPRRCLLLIK